MKKTVVLLALVIVLISPAFAGKVDISGRAGIYSPSVLNASPSLMYGVGADIQIIAGLYARAAVETTTYAVNNIQTTVTPITADIIYRQSIGGIINPYIGAGLGYYISTTGPATTQTMGYQGEAGVTVSLGGFNAGLEFRYMVPDSSKPNSSSSSYNAYASGAFSQSFSF